MHQTEETEAEENGSIIMHGVPFPFLHVKYALSKLPNSTILAMVRCKLLKLKLYGTLKSGTTTIQYYR